MPFKLRDLARCFIGPERAPAPRKSAAVQLPDSDDILREILLRLPPLPSSLPRASLVCKRWRRLVADPAFLRRFREHHRGAPPLLGYFFDDPRGPVFVPTLPAPDRVPPARFSLPAGDRLFFLGCRHGLALLINRRRLEAVVWDPVARRRATVPYPPEFTTDNGAHCCRGTVLCTTSTAHGDDVHDLMRPFKVILVRTDDDVNDDGRIRVSMCVYDSRTGQWGGPAVAATSVPSSVCNLPDVLVGSALCGFLRWPDGILEYDLERHSLGAVQTPKSLRHPIDRAFFQAVRTPGGELGLAVLSRRLAVMELELWGRTRTSSKAAAMANDASSSSSRSSDGAAAAAGGWVLQRTVQLDSLLSALPRRNVMDSSDLSSARILGFDEDNCVIHVSTSAGAFAIRLESVQLTELFNFNRIGGSHQSCYPFVAGFYTAGVPRLSSADE